MITRYLSVARGEAVKISRFPNFHKTGSITGMKRLYYGRNALLVRCGSFIYNVTSEPKYSFCMGFCELSFTKHNRQDVLEFNKLSANDLY